MVDELEKTPIQDRVRQRFADDLAANRREQEEVTGQIADLQERLEQLRKDEAWLTQAQGSLPGAPATSEPAAELDGASAEPATDAPHVPQPRQDQSEKAAQAEQPAKKTTAKKAPAAKKTTAKKAAAKKAAADPAPAPEDTTTEAPAAKKTTAKKAPAKKTTAKKAAAKKTAAKKAAADPAPAPEDTTTEAPAAKKTTAEEKSGPPLWELILGILLKTPGQPCVAREVTDQLSQDHPTRATSIQTVRNNLETLVKKKLAEKSHQQGNAMYTAYADAGAPSAPAADEPASGEGEQAPQAEAEKVPAEV
ncbi:hypothetical protein ACIRQF_31540 [Streptomyces sp. NPDC101191]|uniref:hypothetical protein n=1 Tax=Streptomyces sp. NPDC101191 TaxID=3366126 RepID=UPI00382D48B3